MIKVALFLFFILYAKISLCGEGTPVPPDSGRNLDIATQAFLQQTGMDREIDMINREAAKKAAKLVKDDLGIPETYTTRTVVLALGVATQRKLDFRTEISYLNCDTSFKADFDNNYNFSLIWTF